MNARKQVRRAAAVLFLGSVALWAQPPAGRLPAAQPLESQQGSPPPPLQPDRPPTEKMFHGKPRGRWWTDPVLAKELGLTEDQQKRMDALFQESRLKLIDLRAALQKQEVILQPLLGADQPDESKVLAQIDRVAQARAELEKANARMLLGLRRVLTFSQWKELQAITYQPPQEPGNRNKGQERGPANER